MDPARCINTDANLKAVDRKDEDLDVTANQNGGGTRDRRQSSWLLLQSPSEVGESVDSESPLDFGDWPDSLCAASM